MKPIIISILLSILSIQAFAQVQLANSWVKYNQEYFRIPVPEDGVYRITYEDLEGIGLDPATFDPRSLQIFNAGEEQYMYVSSENSSIFRRDDFIEFYGEKNSGWLDTLLYVDPADQLNPDYSLYTDTAAYYLTWNNSFVNKRYISQTHDASQTYTQEQYCKHTIRKNLTGTYLYSDDSPFILAAEGWSGPIFGKGKSQTVRFNTQNYRETGIKPQIEFATAGVSLSNHNLVLKSNGLDTDTIFFGHKNLRKTYSLATPLDNQTQFSVSVKSSSSSIADNNSLSYASLFYTRNFSFDGETEFKFGLPASAKLNRKISLTNFGEGGQVIFYDVQNGIRTTGNTTDGNTEIYFSQPSGSDKCFIVAESSIKKPAYIKKHKGSLAQDGYFYNFSDLQGAEYIIITHKKLMDAARQYNDYRSQQYSTLLIDIDELYGQFGYGIYSHPASINNFLRYVFTNWNTKPRFVFLMGKSLHLTYFRKNSNNFKNNLVPSMGMPSADMLLASTLRKSGLESFEAKLAVGRLAAKTPDDVLEYLNKMKQHEDIVVGPWIKNVLHFGGGQNSYEQNTFKRYLSQFQDIIEDSLYGAKVYTFLKNDSQPITTTRSDQVKDLIDGGVSMLNFFGHAAAGSFDQNIDDPDAYQNIGRYPVLIANSCYSGDIHTTSTEGISEKWVLSPKRGSIAFLASVNLGYPNELYHYTSNLLKQITLKQYGATFGEQIMGGVNDVLDQRYYKTQIYTCMDMTLHGDPAVKINILPKPDLTVENNGISFDPEPVTADVDSFFVDIEVSNYGRSATDTFNITVTRSLPSGKQQIKTAQLPYLHYKKTVRIAFFTNRTEATGKNIFTIETDSRNDIDETNESNNITTLEYLIESSDIIPTYPYRYAIYPNDTVTLIASSQSYTISEHQCTFEIDKSPVFDSPQKQTSTVNFTGNIARWKVPATLEANAVYYWRVGTADDEGAYTWRKSSFIYIPGKTGWSQASLSQYSEDEFTFIEIDPKTEKYNFIYTPKQLHISNKGLASSNSDWAKVFYNIDGTLMAWSGCTPTPQVLLAVIDSVSLRPYYTSEKRWGQANWPNCLGVNNRFFSYRSANADQLNKLATILKDSVPDDAYIVLYTFNNGNLQNWPQSLYDALDEYGAVQHSSTPNDNPYIFFGKRNAPYLAQEKAGISNRDEIELYIKLPYYYYSGEISSPIIGPVKDYNLLLWENNAETTDSVSLDLYGVKIDGTEDLIISDFKGSEITALADTIDKKVYPFARMVYKTSDQTNLSPATPVKWQIYYDEVPETAIAPEQGFWFYKDSLQEGENMSIAVATQNISPVDMDSLLVVYSLQDASNTPQIIEYRRLPVHPSGDILIDSLTLNTKGLVGTNQIRVEYNPLAENSSSYDQLEKYHYNNYFQRNFTVLKDKRNPILSTTFDGVKILDGDIVSPTPQIEITLEDENKYFMIDDTSYFTIHIQYPGEENIKPVYFSDIAYGIEFIPATNSKRKATVRLRPNFTADGIYKLFVNGTDVAENQAGDIDYSISFEIITKSSITHLLNYPNPFSTATRFVFTLTGNQIPTDLRIQILTVSGKLVREIGLAELGPIRIGRNITDFAWDGTDMFGDRLANGVYLYRVFSSINQQEIEHRETEIDSYFTKGYGKMYLMR